VDSLHAAAAIVQASALNLNYVKVLESCS